MKNLFLLCLLAGLFGFTSGQSDSIRLRNFPDPDSAAKYAAISDKIFQYVEQNPEFPGGDGELIKFMQQHITYPQMEYEKGIEGKVWIRFVVDTDGSVATAIVAKGVSPGLDTEALRVVKMLPKFKPGRQQGKPVKVYFTLPVVFRLGDDEWFREGMFQFKTNDYKAAIKAFRRSIDESPRGSTYVKLAECYKQTGDKKNRCKALQKAVDLGYKEAEMELNTDCK